MPQNMRHGPWGCTHKHSNGFCWSVEDITTLEAIWGTMPDAAVARRIGRTIAAVKYKASRMGLRKKDQIITAGDAQAFLGVSPNTLLALVRGGYITPKKAPFRRGANIVWNFEEVEIERFLREAPWMVNRSTMPYSKFKCEMAEWMTSGEAADRLGVLTEVVWRLYRNGRIPEARLRHTRIMLPATVLPELLGRVTNQTTVRRLRPIGRVA